MTEISKEHAWILMYSVQLLVALRQEHVKFHLEQKYKTSNDYFIFFGDECFPCFGSNLIHIPPTDLSSISLTIHIGQPDGPFLLPIDVLQK